MSIYALAAVGGVGLGPVAAGFVEMNPQLEWRWIQWIHAVFVILTAPRLKANGNIHFDFPNLLVFVFLMFASCCLRLGFTSITGFVFLMVIAIMKETRSTILLTRLARKIRKETGDTRYRARAEDVEGNLRTLIYISCTRPLCE